MKFIDSITTLFQEKEAYFIDKVKINHKLNLILSAEINFISNFTGTKKIFNPKNVFRKIELIQDNYIDKIIGIDLINFPGKEMSLEKYYSIKEKLFSVNTKFIKIENSFLQILEPFKSDFRKNHKTVQSRQYIRDSIKKFSFDDPLNTELDLRILKDEIRLFINGLNQTNLEMIYQINLKKLIR